MVDAGEIAETVNAQKVELINTTDSLTFKQVFNLRFNISRPSRKRSKSDGSVDRLEGLGEHRIEADILTTIPEITTLVGLANLSSRVLPTKNWDIKFTGKDAATDTIRIAGKLTSLVFVRQEVGYSWYHIVIETEDDSVTEV
jgi:hypothetical protein